MAFLVHSSIYDNAVMNTTFLFNHTSFKVAQLTLKAHQQLHLFCVYRPPTSKKNESSDAVFHSELDFLEHCNLPGRKLVIAGDFNVHFDCPTSHSTAQVLDFLALFDMTQAVDFPTHRRVTTPSIPSSTGRLTVFFGPPSLTTVCLLPVMFLLDIAKPPQRPVFQTTRNLRDINMTQFRSDVTSVFSSQPSVTAEQFDSQLKSVLDSHALATPREMLQWRSAPWYSSVTSELRSLKPERRQAERRWLASGLTVHKQIMNSIKHKITKLVIHATTNYYSRKVAASTSCKELFRLTGNLMGRVRQTPLLSVHPPHQLAQVFSDSV